MAKRVCLYFLCSVLFVSLLSVGFAQKTKDEGVVTDKKVKEEKPFHEQKGPEDKHFLKEDRKGEKDKYQVVSNLIVRSGTRNTVVANDMGQNDKLVLSSIKVMPLLKNKRDFKNKDKYQIETKWKLVNKRTGDTKQMPVIIALEGEKAEVSSDSNHERFTLEVKADVLKQNRDNRKVPVRLHVKAERDLKLEPFKKK